ncbi:MAG: bifunctional transaldolase/phosoglucose isomerase [Chloroflexi bacterium]|nr:bifunctional transaldolase/phosoglucose isomerase [Chloroflexota bacterium]
MSETIVALSRLGQSLWYDNIEKKLLDNGEIASLIARGEIRGITSNPSIFQNAIAKTSDYDAALIPMAWAGWDSERIFWQLAFEDISRACDLFQPLYQSSDGEDGYVSLEVDPRLARDTEGTIRQAKQLWDRVNRPNLMIKIPATKEGLAAIRQSIAGGINVNVTLIFSLDRYAEVMEAFLSGLEDRISQNLPIRGIASVASFFVSRVDTKIDSRLPANSALRGQAAVANAKLAYELFETKFMAPRFDALRQKYSAKYQRPLWASTGTKNPAYSDTLYVDNLIGVHTVNTVPPSTLDAFRDHGKTAPTIKNSLNDSKAIIRELEAAGIPMAQITQELEQEGVKAFMDAFTALLGAIEQRRADAVSSLGPQAGAVSRRILQLQTEAIPSRLWAKDAALWADDPIEKAEIEIRLGWLNSIEVARARLNGYKEFANQIHSEGIDRVLVVGMGGSSLTAEVVGSLLAKMAMNAKVNLAILDSTDPEQVLGAAREFPPQKSLYIIASKSGGTAELMAAFNYLWDSSQKDGSRFIAITDPGTSLEALAKANGFRKIFQADPNVGGRFSALTDFGLVPSALLGLDLDALLTSASIIREQCTENIPAGRNPGIVLGAILAEAAIAGQDKLTILCDPAVDALAEWIEQIVAESSGKSGKGILPVPLEPLGPPHVYGRDRLFVYLRNDGELSDSVNALKEAGFPVIEFPIGSAASVGGEFFRWEMAISIACHILGINAFNQPDVQDSKNRTLVKIEEFKQKQKLTEIDLLPVHEAAASLLQRLGGLKEGGYVAINAYLPRNQGTIEALQTLRAAIRDKFGCAVTAGFGPRFQHSTGQFHKGGPNKGYFLQLVYESGNDLEIPRQSVSFKTLLRAQALGDYEALIAAGRRVTRILLEGPSDVSKLTKMVRMPPA